MLHLKKDTNRDPGRKNSIQEGRATSFSARLFLHAVATLIVALLAWIFPLYSVSAPEAGVFTLRITGWSGDEVSAWAFNCWPQQDYTNLFWYAIVDLLAVIAVFILLAKRISPEEERTREREQKLFYAVAVAGWLTPLGVVIFLMMDGFPQPLLLLQEIGGAGTAIARWEPLLWIQIGMATVSLVGALFYPSQNVSSLHPPPNQVFPSTVPGLIRLDLTKIRQDLSQAKDVGRIYQSGPPRTNTSVRT